MSPQPFRLAHGGRIDRDEPLRFLFDGKAYDAFAGDTLASAMLANGLHLISRSFKYHRPRGIFGLGLEDPNALVETGIGAAIEPNARATTLELVDGLIANSQNNWPTLGFDLGAVADLASPLLSAGFYYKTFMGPGFLGRGKAWKFYEWMIRRAAGIGRAPEHPDPDRYERLYAHADVLVIGAGPAGLAAALAAGRGGARVLLVDDQVEAGGQLLGTSYRIDGRPALDWVADATAELARLPDVRRLDRTLALGAYDRGYVACVERCEPVPHGRARWRERLWRVRAKEIVLAAGAIERPLIFDGNDRPGIMLASAVRAYANRYAVAAGRRAVVFANNDDAYRTALDLAQSGVEVAAVLDTRRDAGGAWPAAARERGLRVMTGTGVVGTRGRNRLKAVEAAPLDDASNRQVIECDLLAVSGGWNPAIHLYAHAGGKPVHDGALATFVPGAPADRMTVVGAAAGRFSLGECLSDGFRAGAEAAKRTGGADPGLSLVLDASEPESDHRPGPLSAPSRGGKRFVDLHNDVTEADLRLAAREGYRSVEHVKRYTTMGMGPDQGKTGNVLALSILSDALGKEIPAVGTTTFRPPFHPVSFGVFAGRETGEMVTAFRRTPMDAWHAEAGALFEPVGQWRRAKAYPRPGESFHAAVEREIRAARASVGIFDASTLGKIDIKGPGAQAFVERAYCNDFASLQPGRCRYGLMLGEDGMLKDDGVTARLGPEHYHMTTTSGGAANIHAWLEDWLQTEWTDLDVFLTSVTEQWAVATLSGPKARAVLGPLTDIDLSPAAFPFLAVREGRVAGLPARIFRVSFSGDLSYEINVPARHGLALWRTLMEAGRPHDITPYGTEALHVLRAEKGYLVMGHETDGTVTPIDLGLGGMVSKKKDFLGKRSLSRAGMTAPGRKQLVGLLTKDPARMLPMGAQILAQPSEARPTPMIGHVTSSYMSPTCKRGIAMALVADGRARQGQTVYVPLLDGPTVAAEVVSPIFYDPENARRDG
jgi:sarcosine oxidase subunit alpha